MLTELTDALLDLTSSEKGVTRAVYAMSITACSSCSCCTCFWC